MSSRPWYAHFPADYERKTSHLSMLEHGAYRLLLDHYYATGKPLAPDTKRLQRICRASSAAERGALIRVLAEFFDLREDGYHNARADEELAEAATLIALKVEAGRAGGMAARGKSGRKPNDKTIAGGIADLIAGGIENELQNNTPSPSPSPSPSQGTSTKHVALVALPDWLPLETWDEFIRSRKKITPHASKLLISNLTKLREAGDDPKTVLEQSIMNGWRGLFPLKKMNGNGHGQRRESPHEQTERVARELIAEFNASDAARDHDRDREAGNPLPRLLAYDPGIAPGMDRDAVSGSGAQIARRTAIRG